ncbi:hypothetical protein F2P46_10455 [Massilia sp. CCM 8734]|nr:hypothetical protein [Massilia sp. CCM 8734]
MLRSAMNTIYKASLASFVMFCILGSAGGAARASDESGEQLFRQEKFVAAERAWTKAAKAGDLRAQYMLGLALISGRQFPLDEQRGLAYLAALSDRGHGDATYALYGYRLRKHLVSAADATALLEKAAAQGSVNAQAELELPSGERGLQMAGDELDLMVPTRVSKLEAAGHAGALVRGRKVYEESCQVCHAQGLLNAPRPDDRPVWELRNKQGFDVLVKHAIDGFRAHPAKGGMPALTGDQVRDAVFYMSSGRSK